MAYSAEILADSISEQDMRLTTFEVTFPRPVLAEFNTHRVLSRNSASSRAIPVEKQITRVLDDPFVPVEWGVNQSGMQAAEALDDEEAAQAEALWRRSRDQAVLGAVALAGGINRLKDEALRRRIGDMRQHYGDQQQPLDTPLHKQIANRLLEPYMWHTVVVTATDWDNFFALRANAMAQPEIQEIAYRMKDLYEEQEPARLHDGEWHLPLIQPDERSLSIDALKAIATGRCARVSYLTHDNARPEIDKDIALHDRLLSSGHMSPFEHAARPMTAAEYAEAPYSGNFRGWHQYRKDVAHEDNFAQAMAAQQSE